MLCLQETFLIKQDRFHGAEESTTDTGDGIISGCTPRGVAKYFVQYTVQNDKGFVFLNVYTAYTIVMNLRILTDLLL